MELLQVEEPRQNYEDFTLNGKEFTLGDLTLDTELLSSLYEQAGLTMESQDPDSDDECDLKTSENGLFPNIESLLTYLLFQQEGAHRISERNMNLVLGLLRDTRLDRSKFPKSTSGLFSPFFRFLIQSLFVLCNSLEESELHH